DVGTLRGNDIHNDDLVGVKNVVVVDVADFADGLANDGVVIEFGFGGDFPANDNDVAFGVGFAGDAAARILRQASIQDGVRDRIANFVRVAFANGLGGT